MISIILDAASQHNLDWLMPAWNSVNAYQLLIDFCLLLFSVIVLFKKPEKPEKPLSTQEIQQLIDEWEPEPLRPPKKTPLMLLDEKVPIIQRTTDTHVIIDGKPVLDFTRANFLGMLSNPKVKEAAVAAVQKYGTGTCGPRGFSGTIDAHLKLEERIKQFMDSEDAVMYSYGFVTVSSIINAFSGRGDILVVDKGCNYAIQTGVKLSRSDVHWFNHNDMEDLERILKKIQVEDRRTNRKITRRFIIVEGLYYNFGDIAPLSKIMELKEKYCWRLILDDSCGVGVLGKKGRGTCEYHNIPVKSVEILTSTLEMAASSVGGFCCGAKPIIYHQRLNSSGYVYSCSLPPLLAAASTTAFDILDQNPQLLEELAKNSEFIYKTLNAVKGVTVTSTPRSPVIHLRLAEPPTERLANEMILQDIVDEALKNGVHLTRAKFVEPNEPFLPPPSIRIFASAAHTKEQLTQVVEVIKAAIEKVLASKK